MTRTGNASVHFHSAFLLPGFDEPLPPGEYLIHHDEELIEGMTHAAWLRVRTFIHLPAVNVQSQIEQFVPITPRHLEALLEKDRQQS